MNTARPTEDAADNDVTDTAEEAAPGSNTTAAASSTAMGDTETDAGAPVQTAECIGTNYKLLGELLELNSDSDSDTVSDSDNDDIDEDAALTGV